MHSLLKVTMSDVSAANDAINDGRLQKLVQQTTKLISPEATFFYAEDGFRTALFFFDMKDSAMIPSIAEPFFIEMNARIDIYPAMDMNEMVTGIEKWKNQSSGKEASLS